MQYLMKEATAAKSVSAGYSKGSEEGGERASRCSSTYK